MGKLILLGGKDFAVTYKQEAGKFQVFIRYRIIKDKMIFFMGEGIFHVTSSFLEVNIWDSLRMN